MKRPIAQTALYLAIVFASGIAVGALGFRYYEVRADTAKMRPRNPEEFRARYLKDMQTRLKLSSSQLAELEKILDETRSKFRAIREKYAPETKAIQDEQVSRINSILSPEQQAEYARMRQEREERRKVMEKEGRLPPP